MKLLYLVPVARLALVHGPHDAKECPDPTMRLVIVERWDSPGAQDTFEAYPDVISLKPWDAGKPAPAALVSAFQASKVAAPSETDTLETALWKIRAADCPDARF